MTEYTDMTTRKATSASGVNDLSRHDSHKKHVEINIGSACNNRCVFCVNEAKRGIVPFEQIIAEAAAYAAAGCNSVGFIGGDPTVHPDIVAIGRECARLGYRHINIISNGRLFSDDRFLDSLIEAGFNRFSVSIHSHRGDIEDRLTGVPGSFAQKIAGIRNLVTRHSQRAIREHIALNIIIHKLNINSADTLLKYFSDMGVTEYRLLTLRPDKNLEDNWESLLPRISAVRAKMPSVIRVADTRMLRVTLEPVPMCVFHNVRGIETLTGTDYLDAIVADGDTDARQHGSWRQNRIGLFKTKFPFCSECCFDTMCEGYWKGYVDRLGSGEFHPVDASRALRGKHPAPAPNQPGEGGAP